MSNNRNPESPDHVPSQGWVTIKGRAIAHDEESKNVDEILNFAPDGSHKRRRIIRTPQYYTKALSDLETFSIGKGELVYSYTDPRRVLGPTGEENRDILPVFRCLDGLCTDVHVRFVGCSIIAAKPGDMIGITLRGTVTVRYISSRPERIEIGSLVAWRMPEPNGLPTDRTFYIPEIYAVTASARNPLEALSAATVKVRKLLADSKGEEDRINALVREFKSVMKDDNKDAKFRLELDVMFKTADRITEKKIRDAFITDLFNIWAVFARRRKFPAITSMSECFALVRSLANILALKLPDAAIALNCIEVAWVNAINSMLRTTSDLDNRTIIGMAMSDAKPGDQVDLLIR